jgi:cytochrome b6-f complex iron-sulfur subunit
LILGFSYKPKVKIEKLKGLYSRRRFLRLTTLLLSIYPLKLFTDVLSQSENNPGKSRKEYLPLDLPEGLSFHGEIIANKVEGTTRFFSAVCPHLGCLINRLDKNQLVCPCHGSRFSAEGKVFEGPSGKDLLELSFSTDIASRRYTVHLPD